MLKSRERISIGVILIVIVSSLEELLLIFIFKGLSALFGQPVLQQFFCDLAQTHLVTPA